MLNLEEYSHEEIAETLGISVDAATQRTDDQSPAELLIPGQQG